MKTSAVQTGHHNANATLTCQLLALAVVGAPRIVAALGDAAMLAGEHQTVGAVVQLRLVVEALPVAVAVRHVADDAPLGLARIVLVGLLRLAACGANGAGGKAFQMITLLRSIPSVPYYHHHQRLFAHCTN